MTFKLKFSDKERHLIDLLHTHAPGLSHGDIAVELNYFFGNNRTRRGVIGYFERKKKD